MKLLKKSVKLGIFAVVLAGLVGCGGSSGSDKDEAEDIRERRVSEEDSAMLDEPVKRARASGERDKAERRMELPQTPEIPSYEIDGQRDDWDSSLFRTFNRKSHVESGERFWRGRSDASFSVAIDSDPGFLYLMVDVVDDVVISDDSDAVTDGVIVTFRDPNLHAFVRSVPSQSRLEELVDAETALIFLPDGRFRRYRSDAPLPDNLGLVNATIHDGGYRVELALQLEAFEQVGQIPLQEIAFRVEVLDGDEADRPGAQTILSMLPDRGRDEPRMALYGGAGLLPHYSIGSAPPRKNAIGTWEITEREWRFTSFEARSKYWRTIDDAPAFREAIKSAEGLEALCQSSRHDVRLVEAYQSREGGHRAGLLLCGDRAPNRRCPRGSRTEAFWVLLKPDSSGDWSVVRSVTVFPEPLDQCVEEGVDGEPFHSEFSLFPMDMINPTMWAIGWTRRRDVSNLREHERGITIIDASSDREVVGSATTESVRAVSDQRSRVEARVYLTDVDDDGYLDICQIEDVVDQGCSGLDRGCQTYANGRTILTTIQLYNSKIKRFQRYELSKHPGCTAEFDFASREGYLLLQTRGRIGFLPSPEASDEIDASDLL